MFGYSWKFIIGMLLLLTNQPVGWGGVAVCAYAAKRSGKKCYYAYGTVIYILSWGMVGLGVVLAGPEGVVIAKQIIKRYWWQLLTGGAIIIAGVVFYVRGKKKKTVPVVLPGEVE